MSTTPIFATPNKYVTSEGEHVDPSEMPDITEGADRPNEIALSKMRRMIGMSPEKPTEEETEPAISEEEAAAQIERHYGPLQEAIASMQDEAVLEILSFFEGDRLSNEEAFKMSRNVIQELTMKSLALTAQATGQSLV